MSNLDRLIEKLREAGPECAGVSYGEFLRETKAGECGYCWWTRGPAQTEEQAIEEHAGWELDPTKWS